MTAQREAQAVHLLGTVTQTPTPRRILPIIHVVNLAALLLLGLILVPTAVARLYQLIILLPILMFILLYWDFRANHTVIASYFGLSLSLLFYIIICENIVTIDNLFDTETTRQLGLGLRLQTYVNDNLKTASRNYFERCCDDPLTYIRKPGSVFHASYDCPACSAPYEVVVDETGHLNQQRGLWEGSEHIDLFLAGDSVTEGTGMPGVLESIWAHIPLTMWDLSIAGYGARQKINALLTYALPKHPRWLVVEFFAGNDVQDAIVADVCESAHDMRCQGGRGEIHRRLLKHPTYGAILNISADGVDIGIHPESNFTLAVTKYIIDSMKNIIKARFVAEASRDPPLTELHKKIYNFTDVSYPAQSDIGLRQGRFGDWVRAGMAVTHTQYERLVTKLVNMEPKPAVILLYNPTAYEIYRDRLVDRQPAYDEVSTIQVEGQRAFAAKHGWIFLDLTVPLRKKLEDRSMWMYGRHDGTHWSHSGTAFVAEVLAAELLRVMEK